MAKNGTVDKDNGYSRFMKEMQKLRDEPYTKVGVQSNAGAEADGTPLVTVATANEFGTRDGRIPERSFIRSAIDLNRPELEKQTNIYRMAVVRGKITVERALAYLGQAIQAKIQNRITSNIAPVNAPSTIRRKGTGKGTLIDTGRLLKSIRYVVVPRGGKS